MKKWRSFLLNRDFLYVYWFKMGGNENINIKRYCNLNAISSNKNNFLFAIAELNRKYDFDINFEDYIQTEFNKSNIILYPSFIKEIDIEDNDLTFISLFLTGILNSNCKNLFKSDSLIAENIERLINKVKNNEIECQQNGVINKEDYYDCLNDEFFRNEDIRLLHNDIIEEVFEDKYDKILENKKEEKQKREIEKFKENKNTEFILNYKLFANNISNYTVFFIYNSNLYEFIPKFRTLFQVKTQKKNITPSNAINNLEHFILLNKDKYEDNLFLFTENNNSSIEPLPSFDICNFILFLITVLFFILTLYQILPERQLFELNTIYRNYFESQIPSINTQNESIDNIIKYYVYKAIDLPYNNINNNDHNYNFIQNADLHAKESYINNDFFYLYDVNIFCGLKVSYNEGEKYNYHYEKVNYAIDKDKYPQYIYLTPLLNKTNSNDIKDKLNNIITPNLAEIELKYCFYNFNFEIASFYGIKYSVEATGSLKTSYTFQGFKPFKNFKTDSLSLVIINIIAIIIILYLIIILGYDFIDKLSMLCKNHIHLFELNDYITIIAIIFLTISEIMLSIYIMFRISKFPIILSERSEFDYWEGKAYDIKNYLIITGLGIFFACMHICLTLSHFFPSINLLMNPIVKGVYEFIVMFLIVIFSIFIFTCIAWGIYGGNYDTFSSFSKSFTNMIGLMNEVIDEKLLIVGHYSKNEVIIAISICLIVFLVYFIYMKVFFSIYRMGYAKEISKQLMITKAINRIIYDKFKDIVIKLYCLFTCELYDEYLNKQEQKKRNIQNLKNEEKKSDNSNQTQTQIKLNDNEQLYIKHNDKKSICNKFFSNLKIIFFLFKKKIYTNEEFNTIVKEKYTEIRKQNVKMDLSEIKEEITKKYEHLLGVIFFILFIILFVCLQNIINYPFYQQKILEYFQDDDIIYNKNYNKDKQMSINEVEENINNIFNNFYKNKNNKNPYQPQNYQFVNPYFFRATLRLFKMKKNPRDWTSQYFPFIPNNLNEENLDDSHCPSKSEVNSNYNFNPSSFRYTTSGSENAVDECGGFVYWFDYKSKEQTLSNKIESTDYRYKYLSYISNKNFTLDLNKSIKENFGSIVIDYFYASEESEFIVYIKLSIVRKTSGIVQRSINIDVLPINIYNTSRDFTRFILEIIYFFILIVITFRKFIEYLPILKRLVVKDFNSLNIEERLKFKFASLPIKFYRIDIKKYRKIKKYALCYFIYDVVKIIIFRTILLIFFLVKAFILYILEDFFNLFHFFSLVISYSMIVLIGQIAYKTDKIYFNQKGIDNPIENRFAIANVNSLSRYYTTLIEWQSINAVLMFICLIQNFRFLKSVNIIIASIIRNFFILFADILLFIIINFGFSVFAYTILSQKGNNFSSVSFSYINLLSILTGKRLLTEIVGTEDLPIVIILLIFFFVINFCLVLNVLFGIIHYGFYEAKERTKEYFEKGRKNNSIIFLYKLIIREMENKKKKAEIVINRIINDNYYELKFEEQMQLIDKERSIFCNKFKRTNDFFKYYYSEIKNKVEEYFMDVSECGLIVQIFIYIGLLLGEMENDDKMSDYIKEIKKTKEIMKKNYKEFNGDSSFNEIIYSENVKCGEKIPKELEKKVRMEFVRNYEKDFEWKFYKNNLFNKYYDSKEKILKLKEGENLKKDNNKKEEGNIIKDEEEDNSKEEEINTNRKTSQKEQEQVNTDNINQNELDNINNNDKENQQQMNDLDLKNKENNILSEIKDIVNNNNNINEIRLFEFPKQVQEPNIFEINKSFFNENHLISPQSLYSFPCYSSPKCSKNPPCKECSKLSDKIDNIPQQIFDIYIQHFLFPINCSDLEKNIFLGYHLCNYITLKDNNYSTHFESDFQSYLLDGFMLKFNSINPKETEELKKTEYSLLIFWKKFHIMHQLIYNCLKREEIVKLSEKYNKYLNENKKSLSQFLKLFFYINNITKPSKKNDSKIYNIYNKYNIERNSQSLYKAMVYVLQNESLKCSIKYENTCKKELFVYANKHNFKYIYNNYYENLFKETEEVKDIDSLTESYLNREKTPILIEKLLQNLNEEFIFSLFYGYNKDIGDFNIKEDEKTFITKIITQNSSIDVFSYFTYEEKADFLLINKFPMNEINEIKRVLQLTSDKRNFSVTFEEITKMQSLIDIFSQLSIKKVNVAFQNEILFYYFTSEYKDVKGLINQIETKYNNIYTFIINKRNNDYSIAEKISLVKFVELAKSKEKFKKLKEIFLHKLNKNSENAIDDSNSNSKILEDPIFKIPNLNLLDDSNTKINRKTNIHIHNLIENNIKINHPVVWFCSLPKFDMIDTIQKMRNRFTKQFYLNLFEFIFDIDNDVKFYLKRNIKMEFIERYDIYIKYYTHLINIRAKERAIEHNELIIDNNLN